MLIKQKFYIFSLVHVMFFQASFQLFSEDSNSQNSTVIWVMDTNNMLRHIQQTLFKSINTEHSRRDFRNLFSRNINQ